MSEYTVRYVDLIQRYADEREEIQECIDRVLSKGHLVLTEEVKELEQAVSDYCNIAHCVSLNSGTDALMMALWGAGIKKGDEVIVPAVSWSTTYFPLQQFGLKLKFVDIDIKTLNYDLEKLHDAIGANTRAILAINILGNPNDFEIIQKILKV